MERWQQAGFSLYVHWPFCQSKCPYCDFNSHVSSSIDHSEWTAAFLSELRRVAKETEGRVLGSIFFGGGTPSLMPPTMVSAIIEEAARNWTLSNQIEITLEANPSSVEIGRFRDFKLAGVNRASVGIQALNDDDLRRLGRMHSLAEGRQAIDVAQSTFDRTSFDLIYARQDQSLQSWEAELSFALSIAGEHLSLYQLTVEPETVFGARFARGMLTGLPDEDLGADMYVLTQDMCDAAGLPAYEISNHSRAGAASRHNLTYWSGGDYLGIGPGAHGRLTTSAGARFATVCPKPPAEWLNRVVSFGNGEDPREELTRCEQGEEFLMMGLRLAAGVDQNIYEAISGTQLSHSTIEDLIGFGLLTLDGTQLIPTVPGRLVLNKMLASLLT